MIKIRKEELRKVVHAFMKELGVMLKAHDREEESDLIEKIYEEKKELMIDDTVQYLKEVDGIEVL